MRRTLLLSLALPLGLWAGPGTALGQETGGAEGAQIAGALSAAPAAIAEEAAVMGWPAEPGAEMIQLRAGTNGWVCFPDSPGSPRNDPMCLDPNFMAWIEAYNARSEPELTSLGFGYMLQGGSTASNTDPFAEPPARSEEWLYEPPHVMIVVPDPTVLSELPTDPANGGPWVMWGGTPYAHVMMPVEDEAGVTHSHNPGLHGTPPTVYHEGPGR